MLTIVLRLERLHQEAEVLRIKLPPAVLLLLLVCHSLGACRSSQLVRVCQHKVVKSAVQGVLYELLQRDCPARVSVNRLVYRFQGFLRKH